MDSFRYFITDLFLPGIFTCLGTALFIWAILGPMLYIEGRGKAQQIKMQTGQDVFWYDALGMPGDECKCKCKQ